MERPNPSGHERPKLLLVEDREELRELFSSTLAREYEVLPAACLNDAKALIALHGTSFQMLLTDFDLASKEGDGLDVVLSFRVSCPEMPILLLTGSDPALPRIQEIMSLPNTYLIEKNTLARTRLLDAVATIMRSTSPITFKTVS